LQAAYPSLAAASSVISSRSSGARNLIRMQSCVWYLAIPGTTRTVIVPVFPPAPDAASSSLAGLVLAAVVLAGVALAWLVLADDVVLGSPPVAAGLAESADVSFGTVVSAGLGPAWAVGEVTGGVGGADSVALAAAVSLGGFVAGVGDVLRISVGRSAARGGSARDSPALAGSARADSAFGAAGRGVGVTG
jgi:hypothetical protein